MCAAIACFTRKGFHQTTMDDICEGAGLSPGAVYRYFASKDEIIQTTVREGPSHDFLHWVEEEVANQWGIAPDSLGYLEAGIGMSATPTAAGLEKLEQLVDPALERDAVLLRLGECHRHLGDKAAAAASSRSTTRPTCFA